jgi:hypothetical protein
LKAQTSPPFIEETSMPNPTRAASVAAIHASSINASRKRAGLVPLTSAELEREFADGDRALVRKAVAPRTTSSTGAADAMWDGIITKLNASLSSSRAPIGARRASAAPTSTQPNRVVDWSSIATELNREAGLVTPARRAR